ncbi:MAG: NAD(P)-dependent oxidoreductase [Thermoleophilaceae bacterium]|nr:NAD(P)-dependent oxidoreductase [Thermoleophilaceae bacterium]
MRIFLAGSTGVIGRRLIPLLVQAGHQVTGMTRSEAKFELLRSLGAEPVVADALDREGLAAAVAAARPEAVVHELTDIPAAMNPKKYEQEMAGNDRLRIEGTRNLVDAARAAGASRIVAQSIAFAYAPGKALRTEEDPLQDTGDGSGFGRTVAALASLEESVTGAGGVVLRYGYFYGPGSAYAPDGAFAALMRKRRMPVVGNGAGVWSFVHVDDAASATVAALGLDGPAIFNVCDDEPMAAREWVPEFAAGVGAPKPMRVPRFVARIAAGEFAVYAMTAQPGASNLRFKKATGWEPQWRTVREGFARGRDEGGNDGTE